MASAAQAPILVTMLLLCAGMQRPIVHNISYRPDVSAQCPLPQNTLNMWEKKRIWGYSQGQEALRLHDHKGKLIIAA